MATNQAQLLRDIFPDSQIQQQQHYEAIGSEYDAHYNDVHSQTYMRRFAFEPMFAGVDLAGANVLEAMCGGGQTTRYLLERKAVVTGLDISPQQITNFRSRHPDADAVCTSLLNSGLPSESYDVVAVVGGVHHMPPYVNECIAEIHRLLKPGGYFCFMEPHCESLADSIRRVWYRHDPLFATNEEAINMKELRSQFSREFEFEREQYLGNFGYLFVLNSMVFRIPVSLKGIYSPSMMALESLFNRVSGKPLSCFVAARWKKK